MKNQKKSLLSLQKAIIISLSLFSLYSCQNNREKIENYVASVDSQYISKEDFSKELTFYSKFYSKKYGDDYLNKVDKNKISNFNNLEKNLLDSLIKDQVMLNDLKKNKIKISNNESDKLKEKMLEKLYDENSLVANVEALDSDETSFKEILYRDSIRNEHYNMFVKNSDIKDSEVLDYYNKNNSLKLQYKYTALIFDDKIQADKAYSEIDNNIDFKKFSNNKIKNYEVYNSEFVYIDDLMLEKASVTEKDKVSKIFDFKNKYIVLMINSYNEDENDLLIKAKEKYLKLNYDKYLKNLIKKSNIKVFI